MADPKKRIVVDGLDFGSLFQFPRLLRAVTSAMQPPRLVIGLLMVVALLAIGRTWDSFVEPTVSPQGLLAGPMSAEETETAQAEMWRALDEYGAVSDWPRDGGLDERAVLDLLDDTYRTQRALRVRELGGEDSDLLRDDDARFLATKSVIMEAAPKGAFEAALDQVTDCFYRVVHGVVYLDTNGVYESVKDLFVRLPKALWRFERVFTIGYGLILMIITAICGGALTRMAACEFAGQERLRVRDAFDFALGNWMKLILTPLLPLLIAGAVALLMILLGLFLAPWLDLLGGVLYGAAMLLGFVLAFLLLGYGIGFPLLLPAVACENCDAADAQQRAYAYVLNRPLHLIGYAIVALVGMSLGFVVVSLVAVTMLNFTSGLVGLLTNNSAVAEAGGFTIFDLSTRSPEAIHGAWHNAWAGGMITFWQRLVVELVAAYVIAYLFTSATMMYLLMRRACDGQDIEEIWRPGLAPGTLVPLPRTRVDEAGENAVEGGGDSAS